MIKYFIGLGLFFSLSQPVSAAVELKSILELKPGDKLAKGVDPTGITKAYSYEVIKEKDVIKSVQVEFVEAADAAKFIDQKSSGHCMTQKQAGHVKLNRYFFFDQKTKRRYELTMDKKILGILIQDMPGAVEHPKCTLESFNTKGDAK